MPDDAKKPSQTDLFHPWKPTEGDKSKEINLGGQGEPRVTGWDPDNLDTSTGMIIIYDENTKHFKLSCGGINYDMNWDDMFPTPPPKDPVEIACDPVKDKDKVLLTDITGLTKQVFVIQNPCSLLIYCNIKYTEEFTPFHCDKSKKKWEKGKVSKYESGRSRLNVFTCPCGGK